MTSVVPAFRFAANLKWLFTELPFEQRFTAAADAGFTGVEYASPYEYSLKELTKYLADSGLEQVLINTPDSNLRYGTACTPDARRVFRTDFSTALDYGVELGTGIIHVRAGVRRPDVSKDSAIATYVENLAWAVERSASTGITLVIELISQQESPGFVLESLDETAAVVNAVGHRRVGVLFDVYHCRTDGGDVVDDLARMMPFVAHVQIADSPGRSEPGTGSIPWVCVFEQLRRLQYQGWIGCEYAPSHDTVEGLVWREAFTV